MDVLEAILVGRRFRPLITRRAARREKTAIRIGGLSVGEPKPAMYQMLEVTVPELPAAAGCLINHDKECT